MQLISAEELNLLIRGCTLNQRESQKKLYNSFYSYGMAICDRYTKCKEDSIEIFNDSFLKIFKKIHSYNASYADEMNSFKGWIRKIIIYTAIDHNRKYSDHNLNDELDKSIIYLPADGEDAFDTISYDEIIRAIRELSPAYRTAINLFIIDGFSHEEIAAQLGIAVGTSKSNLFKARQQLQKILKDNNQIFLSQNVG